MLRLLSTATALPPRSSFASIIQRLLSPIAGRRLHRLTAHLAPACSAPHVISHPSSSHRFHSSPPAPMSKTAEEGADPPKHVEDTIFGKVNRSAAPHLRPSPLRPAPAGQLTELCRAGCCAVDRPSRDPCQDRVRGRSSSGLPRRQPTGSLSTPHPATAPHGTAPWRLNHHPLHQRHHPAMVVSSVILLCCCCSSRARAGDPQKAAGSAVDLGRRR